jgi:hypothetical protein
MTGWARWWPVTGLAFVALFLVAFSMIGGVDAQDSDEEILAHFAKTGNQREDIASFFLILAACVLFIWFVGALRHRLVAAGGTRLAPVAFGSGVAATALWVTSAAVWSATSVVSNDSSEFTLDPNTFRLLDDMGYFLWFSGTTVASGVVLATAIVALRTGLLPKWIAWLSIPVVLTMVVAFFFIPFLIMCGWILVVAVTLIIRKEGAGTEAAPAPAAAA